MNTSLNIRFVSYEEAWKTVDHRVDGMLFMSSIIPTLLIVLLSVLIFIFGPKFMRTRKPINIGPHMLCLNIFIIFFNLHIARQLIIGSNRKQYKWLCEPINSTATDEEEMRIVKAMHMWYLCKLLELFDVFFLILRKKSIEKQTVIYAHHVFMAIVSWASVRWIPSGLVFFPAMLISGMHAGLYFYFCCAIFFPAVSKIKLFQATMGLFLMSMTIACIYCGIYELIICPYSPALMMATTGIALGITIFNAVKFVSEFSYEKIFKHGQIFDKLD